MPSSQNGIDGFTLHNSRPPSDVLYAVRAVPRFSALNYVTALCATALLAHPSHKLQLHACKRRPFSYARAAARGWTRHQTMPRPPRRP